MRLSAGQAGGGRFGRGEGIVSGDVIAKDNQTLTVKTPDGSSRIVFYSSSTSVIKPSPASIDDVASLDEGKGLRGSNSKLQACRARENGIKQMSTSLNQPHE